MDYKDFTGISVVVDQAVATITLLCGSEDGQRQLLQHEDLSRIWRRLDADPDVKSVLITGTGDKEFYLSGKPPGSAEANWKGTLWLEREVQSLVYEMINFNKPVVSAINGTASGAGMAVAIMADISVIAEDAILFDPHIMLGISAGDGPGALWPLFTGMAKAKLYLMTSDALDGREADRIGLVSRAVPCAELMQVAQDYARRFAGSPEVAMRFTKRGLNQWYKAAGLVSQDYSFALEALSFFSGEKQGAPHTDWPPRKVP